MERIHPESATIFRDREYSVKPKLAQINSTNFHVEIDPLRKINAFLSTLDYHIFRPHVAPKIAFAQYPECSVPPRDLPLRLSGLPRVR